MLTSNKKISFFLLASLLSTLTIALTLTFSSSNTIILRHNRYDPRLVGINLQDRASPNFSFNENNIAAFSTIIELYFEPNLPGIEKAKFNLILNGKKIGNYIIKDTKPLVITSKNLALFDQLKGIRLEAISSNPIPSKNNPGELLGVKFKAIKLTPRFLLLFPSINFGFLLFSLLTLFYLAFIYCLFLYKKKKSNILLLLIPASVITYLLIINSYQNWDRANWLILIFLLFTLGAIANKIFNLKIIASKENNFYQYLGLILIFCLAIFLRFDGLNFGLPGQFHPDEGRKVRIISNLAFSGDLNPHYFMHPSFLLYAAALTTKAYYLISGVYPDLETINFLGRTVSATLGSLSILILFLIVKLLSNSKSALISAGIFAVLPLHVVTSRYIKEDAALIFFLLVSFYFALSALKSEKLFFKTLLAAFFGGIATSTKYSGLLTVFFVAGVIGTVLLFYLKRTFKQPTWNTKYLFPLEQTDLNFKQISCLVLLSIFCFALGFIIITPYSILDTQHFIKDFLGEKRHMQGGHNIIISASEHFWSYHFKFSILPALKTIPAIFATIACGFLLKRGKPGDWWIVFAVLLFYLPAEYVNAKPKPQPERYIVPCLPFLSAALGLMLTDAFNWFKIRYKSTGIFLALALFLSIFLAPLIYSWQHAQSIKHDTRLQARNWLIKNIPSKSKIFTDWRFYNVPFYQTDFEVLELREHKGGKFWRNFSIEKILEFNFDYLILSSLLYGRYQDPLYSSHHLSATLKKFFATHKPLASFSNPEFAYGFHNPEILIFDLKKIAKENAGT